MSLQCPGAQIVFLSSRTEARNIGGSQHGVRVLVTRYCLGILIKQVPILSSPYPEQLEQAHDATDS